MKWLKENWLKVIKILVAICVIGILIHAVNVIKENKRYEGKIEVKDKRISQLEGEDQVSREIVKGLEGEIKIIEIATEKKDKKMRKKDREIVQIRKDRDKWRKKVMTLPASDVVIESRAILKALECIYYDEIWERPDGILFSLSVAREGLAIFGDFSLAIKERDGFRDNYNTALGKIDDLNKVVKKEREAKAEKDRQLLGKDKTIKEWKGKFDLSENQKKKSWWKGVKTGVPVGAFITLLVWLALGK